MRWHSQDVKTYRAVLCADVEALLQVSGLCGVHTTGELGGHGEQLWVNYMVQTGNMP